LITQQINNTLRFELWGTRDGRVQKQSKITLSNVTQPPEPKMTETSELAEGKTRCYEVAHAGGTTNFTYSIVYPDSRKLDKEIRSVYKPWQQQCLIGKVGAPRIVIDKDGSLKELPPLPPVEQPPAIPQ
jgi:hypothetical protein